MTATQPVKAERAPTGRPPARVPLRGHQLAAQWVGARLPGQLRTAVRLASGSRSRHCPQHQA